MSCQSIKTNIPSLLTGDMSPDENDRMLGHMKTCALCRQEMEALKETWNQMDHWEIEDPPSPLKAKVMAFAREELEEVHIPWWLSRVKTSVFQTVLGALGFSMIIYLFLPYDKIIKLCEALILKETFLAFFPKGAIYFILGLFYGVVPILVSGVCFLKPIKKNQLIKGLGAGAVIAAFLVPFFILQCPDFEAGLIFTMALGIITGSLSGGTGTFWGLSKVRVGET